MLEFTVELPIHVALIVVEHVRVDDSAAAHVELEACAARHRAAFPPGSPRSPGAVPGVEHGRSLFRALGIDPTKRRPSSEALLRRALQERDMPRVSNLVDVGNWCSLEFLLPLGIYDRARLAPPVALRLGTAGESYLAVSGREISFDGRYLLADANGPFGSPMTDSVRTRITPATTSTAVVVYAPEAYDPARLREQAETMAGRLVEHGHGSGDVHVSIHGGSDR
jgi:DNA/RNA-binding domain of Phe-tRNA-synthetase-like protein